MGADHALGIALEMAIALSTGDDDDHVRRTIADKLIALAKAGERNPDVLCEQALEEICRPPIAESRSHGGTARLPGPPRT